MATGFLILWVALLVSPFNAADDAEFAFNLLSDIAPILALFGDQFAKQFTSESLTWVDHLIFAMVPLGIITAITGAIRVQGMPTAKAFIGRAREHQAQAEIELMSSTSGVCEIFNGDSIVRAIGDPKVAQFLIFPRQVNHPEEDGENVGEDRSTDITKQHLVDDTCGIHSLETATDLGLIKCHEHFDTSRIGKAAETFIAAVVAILLQTGLIAIAAITAYRVSPNSSSIFESRTYGFPCYAVGSLLLSIGTGLCSFIVEHSTDEYSWELSGDNTSDRGKIRKDPTGQQLLQVRRRISDLSKWRTRSSPSALALVQSIELILNTSCPDSFNGSSSFKWLLEAYIEPPDSQQWKKEIIKLSVDRTETGKWKLDDGIVDAALSLWMASIDAPRSETADDFVNQMTDQRKYGKAKPDAWRRVKAGDDLTYSFKRVLGNNLKDDSLKRDISWWVASLVEYEDRNSDRVGYGAKETSVVIGFHGDKGEEIEGPQVFDPYDFDQMWPRFRLRHRRLTELVRQIESFGLGRTQHILLCMIPALSNANLLPNQAILKRIPRVGSGHGWVETARCYKKLLDTLKGDEVSVNDRLGVGIVTNTMDFLAFAWEPYDVINNPPKELRDELSAIAKQLVSSRLNSVMKQLFPVHKMQHRQDLFKSIFEQLVPEIPNEYLDIYELQEGLNPSFAQNSLGFTKYHLEVWKAWEGSKDEGEIAEEFRKHAFTELEAEAKDIYGWSPYHYASLLRTQELFWSLLWSRTSRPDRLPRLLSNLSRNPIHITALGGLSDNLAAIFYELTPESKVLALKSSGVDGMTILHLLAKRGLFHTFLATRQNGEANPSLTKKDFWGRQPLHIATKYGNQDFTNKLLAMGLRTDELDEWGMSPIDYFLKRRKRKELPDSRREFGIASEVVADSSSHGEASSSDMNKEESTLFLKFAMENPKCRYGNGRTFLHIAIEVVDEDSIRTLLERGFDLEARDAERRTPLHYAIRARQTTVALALIEGVDIHVNGGSELLKARIAAKDSQDATALMFAAQANLENVATALLDLEPSIVNEVDDEGCTALHYSHDVKMAEFLVTGGFDSTSRNSIKRTPLHCAIERENTGLAEYFLRLQGPKRNEVSSFDNNESILTTACRRGISSLIIGILDVWPDIIDDVDATYGQTPLAWACELGHKDIVTELIGKKADVNKKAAKYEGYAPLHLCVLNKRLDILEILLGNNETDLCAKSTSAQTPLELAIDIELVEITSKLLLHDRTGASERIDGLKEMISQHSESLQVAIWQELHAIVDQSHILDFLIWLFARQSEAEESESKMRVERAKATNLLTPLARDIGSESWNLLKSPLDSNALFGVKDISIMLDGQEVDDTGFDTDGWSYVDYIDRTQSSRNLKDVVEALRKLRPNDKERHLKPTIFKWAEYGEYIQLSPCNTHREPNCHLQDIKLINASKKFKRGCIRSDHCIPPSSKYFYFEVTVLENSQSRILGIGFSGPSMKCDSMPGFEPGSWGYHGDEGQIFIGDDYMGWPREYFGFPTFSKGNTVGVYLNIQTGYGFYTLDGKKQEMRDISKIHHAAFKFGKMYPCVGFDVGPEVQEGIKAIPDCRKVQKRLGSQFSQKSLT
ncbi:hypothetical protein FGLOB1_7208 [Fusarium globosum]|uniref:B30.2/SPRY domain-containing protein n=1 Tax=Fusarium globosum TaxID=78864 RepID=A0A8H6D751_9HYPO|nr:hypothetical protein FGLOB1_7208 [Fusarium globosum]